MNKNQKIKKYPQSTAKKKTSIKKLKGPSRFRKPFIFAVIFAILGAATLLYTQAATATVSYKGAISAENPSQTYNLSVGSGTLTASLKARNDRLRVSIIDANGNVLSSSTGNRAKTSAQTKPGSYGVRVDYNGTTIIDKKSYTVTIAYPMTDTTKPSVLFTSPNTETVKGTVNVSANATDDTGVTKVEFLLDNSLTKTILTSPYSYTWDTTAVTNGSHTLSVKAYDASGNVGVATIPVEVANTIVSPDPSPDPTPAPPPTPPVSTTGGIWISREQIMALPTSGAAWENVRNAAYASWGTPNLADNNSLHDTYTLAGALVAVRTGDAALREKTRAAIMSVRNSGYNRVLEMSRNITSYVVAADILDLPDTDDQQFREFIAQLRTKPLSGHSGGNNLKETAILSPNNWGTMSRAAMTAIDLYIGDTADLSPVIEAHKAWLGESVANKLVYTSTNWHATSSKVGVNRRNATIQGNNVDGVQPEDQRRTGEYTWPAPQGSYPWEALQGALVTGAMLHRANLVSINAGDDALYRATQWLVTTNANPPSGDDRWQPWVLNKLRGSSFKSETPTTAGKNMAWTDWTHQ